jgi:RNA polymerase sigma-70 factor (ECF subfamily)
MGDGDLDLIQRIAAGDERALEHLYARHAQSLLAYAYHLIGDRQAAEEALQDTFVAVWRGAAGFEERSAVRTWLFGICRRQALLRVRRGVTATQPIEEVPERPSEAPGPDAVVLARADASAVAAALATLPAIHREVLDLVFGAELSHTEVAEVLGIPVGTVKSRLFHARAALARALPVDTSHSSPERDLRAVPRSSPERNLRATSPAARGSIAASVRAGSGPSTAAGTGIEVSQS